MFRFFSALFFLVAVICNDGTAAAADALPEANEHGLITIGSQFTAQETTQRLEAAIEERGLTLIAKVQHAAHAREADVTLRPTTLIIFSNAKLAGRLISESQTMGIDLPLKALIWKDADDKVWVTVNDPTSLANRHGVTGQNPSLSRLSGALSALIVDVTSK